VPSPGVADSLTLAERMKIYELAGQGQTNREICRKFNGEREYPQRKIRAAGVDKVLNRPEAAKYVARFRREWLKTVKDVPAADKKVRLDDLEGMRSRLGRILGNMRFDSKNPKSLEKYLLVSRRMLDVLDMARSEVERNPNVAIGIGIGQQGELSDLSDQELQQRREELIRRAGGFIQRGATAPDEITEGDETPAADGPAPVFLAPSEKLRRQELQQGESDVPDVRQQESDDPGVSSV